jgi:2-haloacid dehalogenase
VGAYRSYEGIVRQAAARIDSEAACAGRLFAQWYQLQPWPEARGFLTALALRVPLGVVTNCSRTPGMSAVACTAGRFSAVVTAETAGFYKPRPEPYEAMLAMLGARTLFVAGSAADVAGANGVGMPVFWHNRMALQRVDASRPDFVACSLEPLLDIV